MNNSQQHSPHRFQYGGCGLRRGGLPACASSFSRLILIPALLMAGLVLAGCERVGVGLPMAMIYQDQIVPLTVMQRPGPGGGGVEIPLGLTMGEAHSYRVSANLPLVPGGRLMSAGWGDMGLRRAIDDAGFAQVFFADARLQSYVFGIYSRTTIIVHGRREDQMEQPTEGHR